MANEKEIYDTAMAGYQAALEEQASAYRQAQISGDFQESVRASQAMASIRAHANEYNRMAAEHAQSTRSAARPNPYGLTDDEVDIAGRSIVDRPDMPRMSQDDKLKLYAENRDKLRRMRKSGEYRQTTDQTG